MLDWLFRPSCPCVAAKAWVETRLDWLAGEFDDSAFTGRRVVLPTPAFFPDPEWARHLTGDARADLKQGLRYLHATGDSTYRPTP